MFSIELAGICSNASAGSNIDGRPSINTLKLLLPRRLTLPSISTVTEGIFSRMSIAVPELAEKFSPTLITFLSISYEIGARSPLTTTSLTP